MLEQQKDGSVNQGSMPDSLDRKYFFHDNGKVYKHFPIYEQAVAHFRGYYPREEIATEEGVVYISSAPTVEGKVPEALKVRPGKRVEAVR